MLKQNPTYKYKTAVAASLVAASSLSLPAVVGAHAASDDPSAPQDDHHVGLVVPSDALQEEEDRDTLERPRRPEAVNSDRRPLPMPRPATAVPEVIRGALESEDRPPAAVGEAIRELHRIERDGLQRRALEQRVKSVPRVAATKVHRALVALAAENTGQTAADIIKAVVDKVEAGADRRYAFKEVLTESGVDREAIRQAIAEMREAKRSLVGDSRSDR